MTKVIAFKSSTLRRHKLLIYQYVCTFSEYLFETCNTFCKKKKFMKILIDILKTE